MSKYLVGAWAIVIVLSVASAVYFKDKAEKNYDRWVQAVAVAEMNAGTVQQLQQEIKDANASVLALQEAKSKAQATVRIHLGTIKRLIEENEEFKSWHNNTTAADVPRVLNEAARSNGVRTEGSATGTPNP